MQSDVFKNFWPARVRKFARIWMEFWSLWFKVQVHFVTVFGYMAAVILLLLVSIVLLYFTAMKHYLVFMVFLPVLHTVYMVVYHKLLIYEVIYFHFRFWFPFLQSKTLVEGNSVMVAVWTVENFP